MSKIHSKSRIKRKDNIPWREIGGEGTLLDIESGDYFSLKDVGLFIWKHLDGKKDVFRLAQSVATRYDVSPRRALDDLEQFLTALNRSKLVTVLS